MKKERRFVFLGSLITLAFILCSASAINAQNEERIINKVPGHLPIKVEVLYGKRTRVLENVRVKVTNTGKRPIYSLHLQLNTQEDSGLPIVYNVQTYYFGRSELRTFGNLANADDPSLKPNESIVYKHDQRVERFKEARRNFQQIVPDEYDLIFQFLGFGDDTSFWGTSGAYYSPKKAPTFVNPTDRRGPFFFSIAN